MRLVDAAISLFLREGVEVPLDAIAARAGLGVSTLYRHFRTRDELGHAVMEKLIESVRAEGERNARERATAEEAFRHVFAHGCGMTGPEAALFARLADRNPDAVRLADDLIASVIAPAAARAREAEILTRPLEDEELAFLVRRVESAETPHRRELMRSLILDAILGAPIPVG